LTPEQAPGVESGGKTIIRDDVTNLFHDGTDEPSSAGIVLARHKGTKIKNSAKAEFGWGRESTASASQP